MLELVTDPGIVAVGGTLAGLVGIKKAIGSVYDKRNSKSKFDPHTTRMTEIEIWGQGFTPCACAKCQRQKAIDQRKAEDEEWERQREEWKKQQAKNVRTRTVDGYRCLMPSEVPDNAHAEVTQKDFMGYPNPDSVWVIWTWTDQQSGRQKHLRSLIPKHDALRIEWT